MGRNKIFKGPSDTVSVGSRSGDRSYSWGGGGSFSVLV